MVKLKKLGVLSCAITNGILGAVIGLVAGIFFAFFFGVMAAFSAAISGSGGFAAGFGVLSIIILPIIYGAMCFIGGAILALLYNAIAKYTGGIEVELAN